MAPRKNIRREDDSSTATLTPPPPTPLAVPSSKFIEARPATDMTTAAPTRQQIRERAYQIYLARSGSPGDAASDWFQAERELTEEARKTAERRVVS